MEPLSSTAIAAASESVAETTVAQGAAEIEGGLGMEAGLEAAAEVREAILGEQGFLQQLETIRFDSVESLAVRNDAALSEVPQSQIEANRMSGAAREEALGDELAREYPKEDGYTIESQCPIRDQTGGIAIDPKTGESRRLDFVVIKNREIVESIEVTSETADKTAQLAKEQRIRDTGGNFVKDRETGDLVRFAPGVQTEVVRRA